MSSFIRNVVITLTGLVVMGWLTGHGIALALQGVVL
jgi:hypothetical protein